MLQKSAATVLTREFTAHGSPLSRRFRGDDRNIGSRPLMLKLSGLAETPEIGGNDGLYRARRNPKPFERATFALCLLGDDDVAFEQRDLIRREWRIRQELQEQRLESREPEIRSWP